MKEGNRLFYTANEDEIKRGDTTDVYLARTRDILKACETDKEVVAEISCGSLPDNWDYGVFAGVEQALNLLEGYPVDVECLPEGTVFEPRDYGGVRIPLLNIKGRYSDFCMLETPLLGLLCQATGIATAASRIKTLAGDKKVLSFGVRRMHPAIAPMIDRSCFIGGFDGVSSILSGELMEIKPEGTIPHSLIIVFGDQVKAWKAFDKHISPDVPRVALCDTFSDEKMEVIKAAVNIKTLSAVRLDTPASRRGDFKKIISEIRWELDLKGYENVGIFISGGLDEHSVSMLADSPVDGFGVGTSVSNSPTVDMSLNIVEVEGEPVSKRGVFSGHKQLYYCGRCDKSMALIGIKKCPVCGGEIKPQLVQQINKGSLSADKPSLEDIKKRVIKQLRFRKKP